MNSPAIENRFTYHPPKADQPQRYELIRAEAREFASTLISSCPVSPELEKALDQLDIVVMLANAAIARNE